jgi:hypothetical protein
MREEFASYSFLAVTVRVLCCFALAWSLSQLPNFGRGSKYRLYRRLPDVSNNKSN